MTLVLDLSSNIDHRHEPQPPHEHSPHNRRKIIQKTKKIMKPAIACVYCEKGGPYKSLKPFY